MHVENFADQEIEPLSYWQKSAQSIILPDDIPARADIVVIGGGILGISICYWLARKGATVALLENMAPAYGATGRNGGIVSIGLAESYPSAIARLGHEAAQQILALTLENQTLLRNTIAEENISCDYREPGFITLALNSSQMDSLAQSVAVLKADGVSTQLIDRQDVQEQVRTQLGMEIVGGKFTPRTALLHSAKLVQGLAAAAQRYGAQMYKSKVLHISSVDRGIMLQTAEGSLCAKIMVVATNAWIADLVPEVTKLITPVRGQALSYVPINSVFTTGMSVDLTETEEYWQQAVDGTIILGGCRTFAQGWDVGVRVSKPTYEVQSALEEVFPKLFPSLNQLQTNHRWAGLMAFTPDYLPIVDRIKNMPSVWIAGGFSGHGMAFGMSLGQLLADALMSENLPMPLNLFRLNRRTLDLH